ncbi:hypothetical protein SUGI_0902450 [Cryptomeria japonica]|uniref:probable disease resistance protein At4g33300 n=1 Tax=Cryptomeria japonica TaxID=3369 RepID=UPI0024148A39|nr:probable disease resistance protein At4g33300 [Cryptomeria japonica]GLJ43431.1 hypothetical protein SUGI_0902450 [Cryptomeria japonica]
MTGLVEGAVLGVVFQETWNGGKRVYRIFKGSARKDFEKTVESLLPIIKGICKSDSRVASNLSLQRFQQFHSNIVKGNRMLDECPRSCTLLRKFWVAYQVEKLEKYINEFIRTDVPIVMAFEQIQAHISQSNQLDIVIQEQNFQATQLQKIIHWQSIHSAQLETLHRAHSSRSIEIENLYRKMVSMRRFVESLQHTQISQQDERHPTASLLRQQHSQDESHRTDSPDPPPYLLNFDEHMLKVKMLVLSDGVNVVGITAVGGAGKSTLAKAVCHHTDIKKYFERVIYIIVSESPDLLSILKIMWIDIVGGPAPNFTNVEDAHNDLQLRIYSKNESILVVLDDIWTFSNMKELLFKGEHYRTIVTSRDEKNIPIGTNTRIYPLPPLQPELALSLFCHCAFEMSTIPNTHNEELVKQVQIECKGLPLVLQVIGSSLKGEPYSVWKATRDALARVEFSDDNQIDVLKRLETSIDVLKRVEKQCFLDLAIFPKGQIIAADVLLDIWVYVRGMRRNDAFNLLRKFAARHLLDMKRDPWTPESRDHFMNSFSISQHDVMRQLALFLAEQDNEIHFSRLFMSQNQSELSPKWQTDGDHLCRARIVSIHTGAMKDTQWPGMHFPVVEALVLYFTASEYCIPTFLHTMKKLKVLIIHNNDGAKRAKLSGLAGFEELSQLKTLHLERLIVPPLNEDCKGLKSLQKISLSLCEGLGKGKMFNLPALFELNVDYCIDLEELSAGICSSNSLEILSITHCHSLAKLPDDLGKLASLKDIRLYESPGLKSLPTSICRLGKLELLNISSCMGLKVSGSKSSELKKTLQSVAQLPSLKKVICDEDNEKLFRRSSRTGLDVEVVKEDEFNLDWLN